MLQASSRSRHQYGKYRARSLPLYVLRTAVFVICFCIARYSVAVLYNDRSNPLRVLYIVTSLAEYNNGRRYTTRGDDRLKDFMLPVLKEGVDPETRESRLHLVAATARGLALGLDLLGIRALSRM